MEAFDPPSTPHWCPPVAAMTARPGSAEFEAAEGGEKRKKLLRSSLDPTIETREKRMRNIGKEEKGEGTQ